MEPLSGRGEARSAARSRAMRRLRLAAPIVAGAIAGAFFGLRALSLWTRGGHTQQVPTAGLLYLGSFFVLGGLLLLNRGVWRRMHDGNIAAMRSLSPKQRRAPSGGWGSALRSVQGWMVAREERERDASERRQARAITLLVAGAIVIL